MRNLLRSCAALMLVAACSAGVAVAAEKRIIRPPGTKPGGNFSQGILIDGTLYVSGQAGEDKYGAQRRENGTGVGRHDRKPLALERLRKRSPVIIGG